MADIFISYRRSDGGGHAGRLYDCLRKDLGDAHLFFDVSNIAAGERWRDSLREQLQRCRVMVAVIGPDWFDVRDDRGAARLGLPDDVVRAEIVEAEHAGKLLIPVLVGGAQIPPSSALPADWPTALREIGAHQAMRLDHDEFDADVRRLEARLASVLPGLEVRPADDASWQAQMAAVFRPVIWPAAAAAILTWLINLLFTSQGMDALVSRELAFVFAVLFVVASLAAWGVRRWRARATR